MYIVHSMLIKFVFVLFSYIIQNNKLNERTATTTKSKKKIFQNTFFNPRAAQTKYFINHPKSLNRVHSVIQKFTIKFNDKTRYSYIFASVKFKRSLTVTYLVAWVLSDCKILFIRFFFHYSTKTKEKETF